MSDLEGIEDVFEGWLERPTESEGAKNKNWIKKSFAKKWKKNYFVLRKYESCDQPFMQWFDKEEGWRHQMPRGTLELFPRYKVFKRVEHKAKLYVFEISTDAEVLMLAAESETVMDLWVIQLQMQSALNPRMAGEVFRLKGSGSRQLQRIGARDQRCLLHISRWGLTLALERTRAVLAQWPLTTIRSYESMDCNEFIFEAGRASPMGEGKYNFFTQNGDDNRIFDCIDKLASARLRDRQGMARAPSRELTEDDIERAYDQLRFSLLPTSVPTSNRGVASRSFSPTPPQSIASPSNQQGYHHIGRSDSIGSAHSIGSFSFMSESAFSYNRLERHPSWGSQTSHMTHMRKEYNRLNPTPSVGGESQSGYDRLARSPSLDSYPSQLTDARIHQDVRCPLDLPLHNQQSFGGQMFPTMPNQDEDNIDPFDELTSSSEYKKPPPEVPRTPTSAAPMPQADSFSSNQNERCFSQSESVLSKVGSPNFVYLNTPYSSSVEVLPALYAKVDLSRKTKNKKLVERASDTELALRAKRRSKSTENVLWGSPPTSTHFAAFTAADTVSAASSIDSLVPMIPPQRPQTERVLVALATAGVDVNAEGKAEYRSVPLLPKKKGSHSGEGQVEILERTLSEMPHFSKEKKGTTLD